MAINKNPKVPAGQVMDVAHPGKSTPSATAKPVLVSNRPIMSDPMVVKDEATESESSDAPTPSSAPQVVKRLVIKPLSEGDAAQPDVASTDTVTAPTPTDLSESSTPITVTVKPTSTDTVESTGPTIADAIAKATANQETKEPEDVTPEIPADEPESKAEATTDTPENAETTSEPEATLTSIEPVPETTPKPADKPAEAAKTSADTTSDSDEKSTLKDIPKSDAEIAAAEDAEDARTAALEKLVETRQYFLPINTVEKRRTKRFVVVGILLALVLAAAWADIALDAGLITISNIKPVTHFFSN